MNADDRTMFLVQLLGWQGGTIHDACKELGLDVHSFLYDSAQFDNDGPSFDFRRGYGDACKYRRAPWSDQREQTEYWLGAVCAKKNEFAPTEMVMIRDLEYKESVQAVPPQMVARKALTCTQDNRNARANLTDTAR